MTAERKFFIFRVILIAVLILLLVICLFFGTEIRRWFAALKFDEDWIIGKNSSEIEEKYGKFDFWAVDRRSDGKIYRGEAGYLTKEKHVGYLGTDPEEFYVIYFDSDGIAEGSRTLVGFRGEFSPLPSLHSLVIRQYNCGKCALSGTKIPV